MIIEKPLRLPNAMPKISQIKRKISSGKKPRVSDRQGLATAFHEAGHAFAGWKFNFKLKKATIIPDEKRNSAGHVVTRPGLHLRSLEYTNPSGARVGRLHERIVSYLSGNAAQRRYSPGSVRSYHASRDCEAVADLLLTLHAENEIPHVVRYLETRARNLVENKMNWFVIEHLAHELAKRRTMTGEEVTAAILEGYQRDFEQRIQHRARLTLKHSNVA